MLDILAWVVISALATWRISYMLVNERGAFGVTEWIRNRVGVLTRLDEHGRAYSPNELGKLLECVYCTSVWVALPFALILGVYANAGLLAYIGLWFGISGLALQFNRGM